MLIIILMSMLTSTRIEETMLTENNSSNSYATIVPIDGRIIDHQQIDHQAKKRQIDHYQIDHLKNQQIDYNEKSTN